MVARGTDVPAVPRCSWWLCPRGWAQAALPAGMGTGSSARRDGHTGSSGRQLRPQQAAGRFRGWGLAAPGREDAVDSRRRDAEQRGEG